MLSAERARIAGALGALAAAVLLAALAGSGCAPSRRAVPGEIPPDFIPDEPPAPPIEAIAEPSDWVEETIGELTLEERVGQMVFVRGYGYFMNDDAPRMRRLFELVERGRVGGVCLFQGDVHTSALLVGRLRELSRIPLLISSDFEWGAAMRLRRSTRFPEAMALGAARDPALAYEMGRLVGREARAIGVRQVYAPVADVNNNPANPVINTRSFGEDPELVGTLASAFARGLQSEGVLATAKHFPGHGDTDVDSHVGLPFLRHSRSRLDSVELVPFRRLVADGVGSVMVAHCDIPSLGGRTGLPATLSAGAVESLLVRRMGFRGLVVTDAMDMAGLTRNYGPDSAAVLAVEAGNDVLLLPADEERAIDAVVEAVRSGRIPPERIERSVRKILEAKEWAGLPGGDPPGLATASAVVAGTEAAQLARRIARASITVLKNDGLLPLGRGRGRILHVVVADADDYRTEINRPDVAWPNERAGDYLAGLLRGRWSGTQTLRLGPSDVPEAVAAAARRAAEAGTVLVSVFARVRATGSPPLPAPLVQAVGRITAANPRTVVASFGNPYVVGALPGAGAYLCAYSDAEASAEAALEVLFGEIPSRGRLPVTIPGAFAEGAGIQTGQLTLRHEDPEAAGIDRTLLAALDSVMEAAIADSAFPGGQLVAVRDNAALVDRAYGALSYGPGSPAADRSTLYDLASVTKIAATTLAAMRLFDEGRLGLDDRAAAFLPKFSGGGREAVTVEHLLRHRSGLPPFREYFRGAPDSGAMLDSVLGTPLVAGPGDSTIYSDLGFIVLGKIVEAVSGAPLDRYVDSVFYGPLGMQRTLFRPPAALADAAAPTESDGGAPGGYLRGVVHDENALALGGVAGHAGLFSTAGDLAVLLQMVMNGGTYGGARFLRAQTVSLFTARTDTGQARGLGWDFVSLSGYTSAGPLFGPLSYGHTGFTGTSVWCDPGKKIFVILLTNRVHPTRLNQKIRGVRPAVHDAVMRALGAR